MAVINLSLLLGIKTTGKESLGPCKQRYLKTWCDEECSQFLVQRKQANLQ
jgi:hypothetical protein